MITWHLPVFLYIILAYGLVRWFLKRYMLKNAREKKFFLQYVFCLPLAIAFAGARGELTLDRHTLNVFVVGFGVAFGTWFFWQAQNISQSRCSITSFLDDFVAMMGEYFFLGGGKYITPSIAAGIALSFGAVIPFGVRYYEKERKAASEKGVAELGLSEFVSAHGKINGLAAWLGKYFKFFLYVLGYSVSWGLSILAARYFVLEKVPIGQFILGWYSGTLAAASIIFLFYLSKSGKRARESFVSGDVAKVFFLSLLIVLCMIVEYWALMLAPINVAYAIFMTAEMTIPAVIGIRFFREPKLDLEEKTLFGLGILGGILITLFFRR